MLDQQGNATDHHDLAGRSQRATRTPADDEGARRTIPPLYANDGADDPGAVVARAALLQPYNGWRWYITEWDAETGLCFGLVEGFEVELGYFDLTELAEVTVFGIVPAVERDLYWEPQTLGEIRRQSLHPSAGGGSWSAAAELVAPRYSVSLKFSNTTQYLAPPGMTVPGGTVAAGAGASCPSIALHHPQTFLPGRAGSSPQS